MTAITNMQRVAARFISDTLQCHSSRTKPVQPVEGYFFAHGSPSISLHTLSKLQTVQYDSKCRTTVNLVCCIDVLVRISSSKTARPMAVNVEYAYASLPFECICTQVGIDWLAGDIFEDSQAGCLAALDLNIDTVAAELS